MRTGKNVLRANDRAAGNGGLEHHEIVQKVQKLLSKGLTRGVVLYLSFASIVDIENKPFILFTSASRGAQNVAAGKVRPHTIRFAGFFSIGFIRLFSRGFSRLAHSTSCGVVEGHGTPVICKYTRMSGKKRWTGFRNARI